MEEIILLFLMDWYIKDIKLLYQSRSDKQIIFNKLHSSHIGVESSIRRAREMIYWPGMNDQIKDFIRQCDISNSYQKS